MSKNIILIGFMAAGKSLTSIKLAELLNIPYFSSDQMIEAKSGKTIKEIFEQDGEAAFRRLESEVIAELSKKENVIVDCGGGVVTNPENLTALKSSGTVFYLATSPEWVLKRVEGQGNKPLLNVEDPLKVINELLEQRKDLYAQADYEINTDGLTIEDTVEKVMEVLNNE